MAGPADDAVRQENLRYSLREHKASQSSRGSTMSTGEGGDSGRLIFSESQKIQGFGSHGMNEPLHNLGSATLPPIIPDNIAETIGKVMNQHGLNIEYERRGNDKQPINFLGTPSQKSAIGL